MADLISFDESPKPLYKSSSNTHTQLLRKPSYETSEKIIFQASAGVFVASNNTEDSSIPWIEVDGGISTIVITQLIHENLFRLFALSIKQEYVINTWIVADMLLEDVTDNFVILKELMNGSDYGFSFKYASDKSSFVHYFQSAIKTSNNHSLSSGASESILRQKVVQEIVATEKSYVESLGILVQVFLNPLRESAKTRKPLLSTNNIKKLFSEVEVIHLYHKNLLEELTERAATNSYRIGDSFIKMKDFFKVYNQYINNYNIAIVTLEKCKRKNAAFSAFLQKCQEHESVASRRLQDFLIMPIQRIPRYVLLLSELLKHTSTTADGYDTIVNALTEMRHVADVVNNSKKDSDRFEELMKVYNKLEPILKDLVEPHRKKVREGPLVLLKKGKRKERYCFLFNDLMLITRPELPKYWLRIHITLQTAKISHYNPKDGPIVPNEHAFVIICPSKSVLLEAPSKEEKELWMKDIGEAISASLQRYRMSLKLKEQKIFE